jgi:hypothetical protein
VKKSKALAPVMKSVLKLDFGCGPHPREGFEGVDVRPFDGKVTHVVNLSERLSGVPYTETLGPAEGDLSKIFKPWPWADNSVIEAHASHVIEHFNSKARAHFVNELYRVLHPGGTCQIIVPHWASCRAYGDLTHEWPPVSEFWPYYLSRAWRKDNAPHNDAYTCDLEMVWGYNIRPDITVRNQEFQQFALANYKEAAQDMVGTIRKP